MKKLGLLLGSFDPIHIAHIHIAACVLNSGLCDKVLFVVAKHNPWKKNEPAPFELRCKMIEAAIKPFGDKCEVCTLEDGIEPPTYSYKVLGKIRECYPEDELFLVCGTDTIDAAPQWKKFDTEIKDKFGFIEVKRSDGTEIDNEHVPFIVREGSRASLTNKEFWSIKPRRIDVSSTIIRSMVKGDMNPYPYVTEGVLQIINENGLYRNG